MYFGNVFTARKVFIVTSYFNFLYSSVLHFWPLAISSVAEVFVSIQRVQDFLLLPESKDAVLLKRIKENKGKPVDVLNDEMELLLNNGNAIEKVAIMNGNGKAPLAEEKMELTEFERIENEKNKQYSNGVNTDGGKVAGSVASITFDRRRFVNENAHKKGLIFQGATAGWLREKSGSNVGKLKYIWFFIIYVPDIAHLKYSGIRSDRLDMSCL